ncbi:MAG: undecaprenyl-diphosphate phosphatase [Prevotellaceae bacterium]|nr:undecaprenyl-diphosphate phosphatase [Prevotellaceae bacterium]
MDELQALLLGLIQGLTEYLPVSSSGHLTIASNFFGLEDGESNLAFTVAVHVATVLSTIVILWKEISWLVKGMVRYDDTKRGNIKGTSAYARMNPEHKYMLNIIVSMIPVGIVGVFFKDYVEEIFGSGLIIVGAMLLLTALLLTLSYYMKPKQKKDISLKDAFIIGLAQAVAVMPGLSRSGSTIATGLMLGNDKSKLAQFSFIMVIPPILGEALLDTYKMAKEGFGAVFSQISVSSLVIGFIAAFISGCIACKWMISIVKKGKLIYFAIYCAIVGLALLVL